MWVDEGGWGMMRDAECGEKETHRLGLWSFSFPFIIASGKLGKFNFLSLKYFFY